ncbi:MAG: complex I subunit 5 family protein, partial [Limisphaerales bacterium]
MIQLLPGLIVALPFLAAAIIRIPLVAHHRVAVDVISVLGAALTGIIAAWACAHGMETPIVHWIGGWVPRSETAIGIALVADGMSAGFITLTAVITTTGLLFMCGSYKTSGSNLHILTLVFLGAFAGFVLAGDLLTMFVFLELMGISSYILTAFKENDDAPVQAGFNVAVVSTLGAFIFLIGSAMIYGIVGTPNLAQASERVAQVEVSPALTVAFALLLSGLSIKAGLLPFHFAHVDSHSVAPTPHAGLFGTVLLQAGLYGIARIGSILFEAARFDSDALRNLMVFA